MGNLEIRIGITEDGTAIFEMSGQNEATLSQLGLAMLYLEKAKLKLLDVEEMIEPDFSIIEFEGEGDE